MSNTEPAVKSAFRVLDILELLAGRPIAMPHAQIAQSLDIPKSSLTGLLRTLAERGYVAFSGGGYRLGPRVAALAVEGRQRAGAGEAARPIVAALRDDIGESVGFSVPEGDSARVVAAANADHPLVYIIQQGNLLPLYATSAGKAILASMTEDELVGYLERTPIEPLTGRTVKHAQALRSQLQDTRQTGIAMSIEERHPGITGMGAPVLDAAGRALGALHVAVPTARFDSTVQAKIATALREAAKQLSKRLAGHEDGQRPRGVKRTVA